MPRLPKTTAQRQRDAVVHAIDGYMLARVYKTGQQNGYQQGFDAEKKEATAHGG